ncbi:type II restriction endonuclease [Bacteroidia bacterium]|nr:type II restriction endonuclease [Bacteroidia bacterium]
MSDKLIWITDEKLYAICENIVNKARAGISNDVNFKNIVDPFSALFDVIINDISFDDWLKNENIRQSQKTLQNMIGTFHQQIIGCVDGWQDLGVGDVIDLCNPTRQIIAEVKNKYNTVKGSDKVGIFDNLAAVLNIKYRGYTGYYVTILAKGKIDKPFIASDNKTGGRRPTNENIREIDGASFYELATGSKTALFDLYSVLPDILADITGVNSEKVISNPWFKELFIKAVK